MGLHAAWNDEGFNLNVRIEDDTDEHLAGLKAANLSQRQCPRRHCPARHPLILDVGSEWLCRSGNPNASAAAPPGSPYLRGWNGQSLEWGDLQE